MTLGKKIKTLRLRKSLTQEDLAKALDTTKQTIYKYETAKVTNLPIDRIEQLAHALDTTPAYLMGWEDEKGVTDVVLAELDYQKRTGCSMDDASKYVEASLAKEKSDDVKITAQDMEIIALFRQLSPEREKMFLDLLKDISGK